MLSYVDGDMEAFKALYQRHKGRVFGFLMNKLKDRSDAEDIFQTVFSKLHRNRHQYRREVPFLPWLFTLVRHTMIDSLRKKTVYENYVTISEEAVETYSAPVSDASSAQALIAELTRLTESQRQALKLRFNQGLSFAEIAQEMRTSEDNSRQIISRAIRRLRSLLGRKESRDE
ncbi:MAG: sigma-70 family RNA polymerase sigma factor [Desulfovibrio sp.]|nr:sigma-70 family RNA polymerase sigma factor [Desulfovibrio sp.]MBI4961147.1 sigma-70 family RNA polymerase sigma factor [Desulfovibrio sp.]